MGRNERPIVTRIAPPPPQYRCRYDYSAVDSDDDSSEHSGCSLAEYSNQ
ncbi:unnamed protein product, partial [Rotaria socialis]